MNFESTSCGSLTTKERRSNKGAHSNTNERERNDREKTIRQKKAGVLSDIEEGCFALHEYRDQQCSCSRDTGRSCYHQCSGEAVHSLHKSLLYMPVEGMRVCQMNRNMSNKPH